MSKLNICIIGLGLIGASLGLAIKKHLQNDVYIIGIDRAIVTTNFAVENNFVDYASNLIDENIKKADIVFLCTPVLQIVPMVEKILPYLKPDAILTDVGSTKGFIWSKLKQILPHDIDYVAGHPMTGSEQSGIKAANAELFRNKGYILIPQTAKKEKSVKLVNELLKVTGANITTMGIEEHDAVAAVISHVPHVVAAGLVNILGSAETDVDIKLKLAGGGFKDTTRIASSNSDMWADICISNADNIIIELEKLQTEITGVITDIKNNDRDNIYNYFYKAKCRRDKLIDAANRILKK